MTLTISLPAATEAKLRDRALATGKDMPTLVREAIEEKLAAGNGVDAGRLQSAADFDKTLDDFFAANPESLPALPADFSRADIYTDHD